MAADGIPPRNSNVGNASGRPRLAKQLFCAAETVSAAKSNPAWMLLSLDIWQFLPQLVNCGLAASKSARHRMSA